MTADTAPLAPSRDFACDSRPGGAESARLEAAAQRTGIPVQQLIAIGIERVLHEAETTGKVNRIFHPNFVIPKCMVDELRPFAEALGEPVDFFILDSVDECITMLKDPTAGWFETLADERPAESRSAREERKARAHKLLAELWRKKEEEQEEETEVAR